MTYDLRYMTQDAGQMIWEIWRYLCSVSILSRRPYVICPMSQVIVGPIS